jgi:hypothetical protein
VTKIANEQLKLSMIIYACFCFISYRARTSEPSSIPSSTTGPSAFERRALLIHFKTDHYKGTRRTANATANATATKGDGGATTGQEIVGKDLEVRRLVTCLVQNKCPVRCSEVCFACLLVRPLAL